MPRFVQVLGFDATGVRYLEDREVLERFFDDAHDHTDDTLREQLALVLASMPDVVVRCVTAPEGRDRDDVLKLHVAGAGAHRLHAISEREAMHRADASPADHDPSAIAGAILAGAPSFRGELVTRGGWLTQLTEGTPDARARALASASRLAASLARDEQTRARRKQLTADVLDALRLVPHDAALREELWNVASRVVSPSIRQRTIEALRGGDPTLRDAAIERQRKLVLEELPKVVGRALRDEPHAAWLPRAHAILDRYGLAPTTE